LIAVPPNYATALQAFTAGKIIYTVEIAGYGRVFSNDSGYGNAPWLGAIDDMSVTIEDVDGGADQISFGFSVQDRGQLITGDFPSFTFEGKAVTIKTGFPGMDYADFAVLFNGLVDSVSSINSNLDYYFNLLDISDVLAKVIFPLGNDGKNAPSSDNPLTLNAHPLDILLNILLTEVGLDSPLVDSAKIEAYRDGPFAGIQFIYEVSQSPAALDFITAQIMKPLGGYAWINSKGQVTVNFFYPLAGPVAVFNFNPSVWTSIPSADQISSNASRDMINTVQFQFDKDDRDSGGSGNYLSQDTEEYGPSVSLYGVYGETVIQADGLRSAFQGFFISKLISRLIFLRYGLKTLLIDSNAADSLWNSVLLEPGDIVSVTHDKIPDRKNGVMGITNKLFEIISKAVHFTTGTVTYSMLDASYLSTFGFFKIAPTGEGDYTTVSAGDKAKYEFFSNDSAEYSNGDAGNVLG